MFHTNLFPFLISHSITLCLSLSMSKLNSKPEISLLHDSPSPRQGQLIMVRAITCYYCHWCWHGCNLYSRPHWMYPGAGWTLIGWEHVPVDGVWDGPRHPHVTENCCSGSTRKDKLSTDSHLPTHIKFCPADKEGPFYMSEWLPSGD